MAGRSYGILRMCNASAEATHTRDAVSFKLVKVGKHVSQRTNNQVVVACKSCRVVLSTAIYCSTLCVSHPIAGPSCTPYLSTFARFFVHVFSV